MRFRYTRFERCCWLAILHSNPDDWPMNLHFLQNLGRIAGWLGCEWAVRVGERRIEADDEEEEGIQGPWHDFLQCVPRVYREEVLELGAHIERVDRIRVQKEREVLMRLTALEEAAVQDMIDEL